MGYQPEKIAELLKTAKLPATRDRVEFYKGMEIRDLASKGQNPTAMSTTMEYVKNLDGNKSVMLLYDELLPEDNRVEATSYIYSTDYEFLNDEKIKQKASVMAESELNTYFYKVVYSCLEWDARQYVTNFEIYEYDLNWESHNIFREGYLFMGLPGERSTAQPERDFYIHIMPPYGNAAESIQNLPDEVYLFFKNNEEFKEMLSLYAGAQSLAQISEGKDKDAYLNKANIHRRKLVKYLSENKNTCFDVTYDHQRKQMIEILRGKYNRDLTFKDTIDLAASILLDGYFCKKYPEFPVFRVKLTRKNRADITLAAFQYFAGKKTQQASLMLQSFGLLDGEKIKPEGSKYAMYFINKIKELPLQGVLNFSDLFDVGFMDECFDKKYQISYMYTPIIFLSMVYAGYAVITLKDNKQITASNLDQIPKLSMTDLYEFKYLSKPAQMSMAELKHLFDVVGINPVLLDNPNDREKGVAELLSRARELSNASVLAARKLSDGFDLWGEQLVNNQVMAEMRKACDAVRDEFSNYSAKYNTPAKLNNFSLSLEDVGALAKQISLVETIQRYGEFKSQCAAIVSYISNIEYIDLGEAFKAEVEQAKTAFRESRDSILDGATADVAAQRVETALSKVKDKYIGIYFAEHKKKRLDINDAKRRGKIQESAALSKLKKLRTIEIVSSAKLSAIEQDISGLTVCYELTPEELKSTHICPHCRYNLGDKAKNVYGQLDNIENRIDDLVTEWTKTLLDTISDPIVASQKEYLTADQQKAIDEFVSSGELPMRVDDFFVKAITALLQGFEPVVIDSTDLVQKLEELPPMDEATFEKKIKDILSMYTKGKDLSKLRIVVKRKDSEV